MTTAAALRDGTDATGRTWWEGGATGEMWKRCDTPLSLLPVLRNLQCTLRDSMLRMSTTSRQQMQVCVAGMSHFRDEIRLCLQDERMKRMKLHVEKSNTSRQQLQVCVAGMSHGGFLLRLQCVIVSF